MANAVWDGHDPVASPEDLPAAWSQTFWQQPARTWQHMMGAGPYAYFLASYQACRIMAEQKRGLIVSLTDGIIDGVDDDVLAGTVKGQFGGPLL